MDRQEAIQTLMLLNALVSHTRKLRIEKEKW